MYCEDKLKALSFREIETKNYLFDESYHASIQDAFQEIHEYESDKLSLQESDSYLQLMIQQNFNHFPL